MVEVSRTDQKNMGMSKKGIKLLLFIIITIYASTSIGHARNYKIGITPWAGCSPFNVAEAKGFWSKSGIYVEVVSYKNTKEMIKALKYRRVHIIYQMMGTLVDLYMKGVPLKIIAESSWSNGGDKIIVKKGVDITSLNQEKFGLYLNDPSVLFFAHKYLSSQNLKSKNFQFSQVEPQSLLSDFIADKFKAIVIYNPFALNAEKEGNGNMVATSADFPGCMPEGMAARIDVLNAIPHKDMISILTGLIQAVRWLKDENNAEEFKHILNSRTFDGYPALSNDDIKLMLNDLKIHDPGQMAERNRDNGGLYNYLGELKQMLKANNMLKKDFDPKKIFDNKNIMKALKAR